MSHRWYGRNHDSGTRHSQPRFMTVHRALMANNYPPSHSILGDLPMRYDQLNLGSCEANAGAGFLAWQDKSLQPSRLDLYWQGRNLEGTVNQDSGLETQDMMRVLTSIGGIPEADWPYDVAKFTATPPVDPGKRVKLRGQPTRLMSALEIIQCIYSGTPFILGFEVPRSFEDDVTERTGIMRWYDPAEPTVGGHGVLCGAYDLDFPNSEAAQKSGIDKQYLPRHAIGIVNSWSSNWGLDGVFWMDMRYAVDQTTCADLWTAREKS